MRIAKYLGAFVSALMAVSAATADIVLVDNGQPAATIVIRAGDDGPVRQAAEGLQSYVERMSGASLPIASDAEGAQGTRVLIGSSVATENIEEDLSEERLGYDGCLVRTLGKDLAFLGPRDAGAANGVYWFLEWKLGVHRFGLRDDALVVPQRKTVSVKDFYYAHKPSFAWRASWLSWIRDYLSSEEMGNSAAFSALNRVGGVPLSGGHSLHALVPPSLFEEHPEYFPLINGERTTKGQLCLSNPGVLETVLEKLKARSPDNTEFTNVSPNDVPGWCECEDCKRMAEDPAARMMIFCNWVVEALEPTHPKLGASFLAYTYSETMEPPLGLKAHPRVVPLIAPLGTCVIHSIDSEECPDAVEMRRIDEGWRHVAERVTVYPYMYAELVPLPTPAAVAREIKYYHHIGLFGVQREYTYRGLGWELSYWLEWQLLWDADQDVDCLRNVFFEGYYGEAAQPMRRLYESMEAAVESTPVGQKGRGDEPRPPHPFFACFVNIPPVYTNCAAGLSAALAPTLRANRRDVKEALRLADTPTAKAHVQFDGLCVEAIADYVPAYTAYERWRGSQSEEDRDEARRRLRLAIVRLETKGQLWPHIGGPLGLAGRLETLRAALQGETAP